MKAAQKKWTKETGWVSHEPAWQGRTPQLVLVFGATDLLKNTTLLGEVAKSYPGAIICGCSTAGEIAGRSVLDDSLVVTAIHFDHTRLRAVCAPLKHSDQSLNAGEILGQSLSAEKSLSHVFVLADGLKTNGTALLAGLARHLPPEVTVSGGLAGDGARFAETLVLHDGRAQEGIVVAIGFYGDRFKAGCSSFGGWDAFGPDRRITKSRGNVLYEMDGQSALALYKKYLGDESKNLPGSALLFPLCLRGQNGTDSVVRTVLSVNESDQSMTFAGDIPEGALARLMKANFDRLIDGAERAAMLSRENNQAAPVDFAMLISCVGRKLLLKQRVEEEVEAVGDVMGPKTVLAGFYSYGEISPFFNGGKSELHNQTMTVAGWSET